MQLKQLIRMFWIRQIMLLLIISCMVAAGVLVYYHMFLYSVVIGGLAVLGYFVTLDFIQHIIFETFRLMYRPTTFSIFHKTLHMTFASNISDVYLVIDFEDIIRLRIRLIRINKLPAVSIAHTDNCVINPLYMKTVLKNIDQMIRQS